MAVLNTKTSTLGTKRIRFWYAGVLLVMAIFGVRLFYVQIIRYDHYKKAALSDQLKQYDIPATRGVIKVRSSGQLVPIVLNQKLYTLYGDPGYVKDANKIADKVTAIIGGDSKKYADQLRTKDTRYVVLAKKLTPDQNKRILQLKFAGLGTTMQDYRTYPQGDLAAQLLGFVDDSGNGQYGVEETLNEQLRGTPGQLKAITDVSGVPLAASRDNTQTAARSGDDIVLTLDLAIQQQMQTLLQKSVKTTKASGASAIVMDPYSGAIKAMANYPSYDPGKYYEVEDAKVYQNASVSEPIEVGSIMKSLTTAAALDRGVIGAGTSYYDPASWKVDGFNITNIEEDGGAGTRNIADILNLSLNTGATWELMQMGGGSINDSARSIWHDYMVNHYRFGKTTGIEQGYEAGGFVPGHKDNGAGIDLTYANTTFGQAMTATPVQMAAAMSAVLNGGNYFQPHLVSQTIDKAGKSTNKAPKILARNVVSPKVTKDMIPLLQNVIDKHYFKPAFDQDNFIVGGKTGTAQIAKPGGGYYGDRFNGTYLGFVGGDRVQYVIVVFVDKPTNGGYAGTAAAQPIFASLAHMLIDESLVTPKTR